ncbi:hypothetical protein ACI799_04580 [Blastococcus sp. SYSU DS0753]
MANDRPDPGDFLAMAQRMLRDLLGDARGTDDPWSEATRRMRESSARNPGSAQRHREPSPREQRENLTFALATRAVEALEDLALDVAAIRQNLERTSPQPRTSPSDATSGSEPEAGSEPTSGSEAKSRPEPTSRSEPKAGSEAKSRSQPKRSSEPKSRSGSKRRRPAEDDTAGG